ncbi:Ion channel [Ancylostoma duodenale]|uniref:Ion channel n=1 Tax=Ancylostoma duodenale TaxID=51022 RepID=A0A0C2GMZ3_9BILA|nr:Ion channel [Ancylostoma duodenale]
MLSTARDMKTGEEDEEEETKDENEPRKTGEAVALGLTFTIYLLVGAKVLSVYEPEMDFFKAFYFNFVTLTTIGFDYLTVTLCYIGIGLALTTMAIELAADLLRKLHYVGRKMDNMANVVVWFGGKK